MKNVLKLVLLSSIICSSRLVYSKIYIQNLTSDQVVCQIVQKNPPANTVRGLQKGEYIQIIPQNSRLIRIIGKLFNPQPQDILDITTKCLQLERLLDKNEDYTVEITQIEPLTTETVTRAPIEEGWEMI